MATEEQRPSRVPPGRGKVNVRHYGSLKLGQDMRRWPSSSATEDGYDFLGILEKEGVKPKPNLEDPDFWQAAVRWALLTKYECLEEHSQLKNPFSMVSGENQTKERMLNFSKENKTVIANLWNYQCDLATASESSTEDHENDLLQFLRDGGLSNHRRMQWSFLDCGPACRFQLHAHPNVEIIYCVTGELHEIRLDGPPPTKTFQILKDTADGNGDDNNTKLKGPDLSQLSRPWKFCTLQKGEFLVNEVGSIHKSFSSTNGNGCQLLVCWGGSHADVTQDMEPTLVNVQSAVDMMDARLSLCACRKGGDGAVEALSETFLPASERSAPSE